MPLSSTEEAVFKGFTYVAVSVLIWLIHIPLCICDLDPSELETPREPFPERSTSRAHNERGFTLKKDKDYRHIDGVIALSLALSMYRNRKKPRGALVVL